MKKHQEEPDFAIEHKESVVVVVPSAKTENEDRELSAHIAEYKLRQKQQANVEGLAKYLFLFGVVVVAAAIFIFFVLLIVYIYNRRAGVPLIGALPHLLQNWAAAPLGLPAPRGGMPGVANGVPVEIANTPGLGEYAALMAFICLDRLRKRLW